MKPTADKKVRQYLETGSTANSQNTSFAPGEQAFPVDSSISLSSSDSTKLNDIFTKIRSGLATYNQADGYWREEFNYDADGNITLKRNGWGEVHYKYNSGNQLSQAGNRSYQYDLNGNLIKELLGASFADYQYNYEDRLVNASNQFQNFLTDDSFIGSVKYGYDALGRKMVKESDALYSNIRQMEYYTYNGLGKDVLAEYKISGAGTSQTQSTANGQVQGISEIPGGEADQSNEYYYGNGQLLATKNITNQDYYNNHDPLQNVSFYQQDALGSVSLITDRNGQISESYQYDAFGKAYNGDFVVNNVTVNPYGFTGQRFEKELGIYSFPFRDYNPMTKRWMTVSPIKDGGNWYQYCYSNPINLVDPDGLDIWGSISNMASSAVNSVTKTAQQISSTASSLTNSAVNSISQTAQQVKSSVTSQINSAITGINQTAQQVKSNVTSEINSAVTNISQMSQQVASTVASIATTVADTATNVMSNPRVQGAIQIVSGLGQIGLGTAAYGSASLLMAAPDPTCISKVVGCLDYAYGTAEYVDGANNIGSGIIALCTGQNTNYIGELTKQEFGTVGENIYTVADMGLSIPGTVEGISTIDEAIKGPQLLGEINIAQTSLEIGEDYASLSYSETTFSIYSETPSALKTAWAATGLLADSDAYPSGINTLITNLTQPATKIPDTINK